LLASVLRFDNTIRFTLFAGWREVEGISQAGPTNWCI
jgi:hypothetical protein